jgi:hypothetical protein
MNAANLKSFRLSVGNSQRNLRFQDVLGTNGMIQQGTIPVQTGVVPTSITMASDGSGGNLRSSGIFAVLRADVLLGDAFRTELPLTIEEFAGGFSDLEAHNGLLVAEYCAIDRRYLDVSRAEPFSRPTQQPLPVNGVIEFYMPDAGMARLQLVDPVGRVIETLFEGTVEKGLHAVVLPSQSIATGMYTVMLGTSSGEYATPVVIVR